MGEVFPASVSKRESGGDEHQNHEHFHGRQYVLHARGTLHAQAVEDGESRNQAARQDLRRAELEFPCPGAGEMFRVLEL